MERIHYYTLEVQNVPYAWLCFLHVATQLAAMLGGWGQSLQSLNLPGSSPVVVGHNHFLRSDTLAWPGSEGNAAQRFLLCSVVLKPTHTQLSPCKILVLFVRNYQRVNYGCGRRSFIQVRFRYGSDGWNAQSDSLDNPFGSTAQSYLLGSAVNCLLTQTMEGSSVLSPARLYLFFFIQVSRRQQIKHNNYSH